MFSQLLYMYLTHNILLAFAYERHVYIHIAFKFSFTRSSWRLSLLIQPLNIVVFAQQFYRMLVMYIIPLPFHTCISKWSTYLFLAAVHVAMTREWVPMSDEGAGCMQTVKYQSYRYIWCWLQWQVMIAFIWSWTTLSIMMMLNWPGALGFCLQPITLLHYDH